MTLTLLLVLDSIRGRSSGATEPGDTGDTVASVQLLDLLPDRVPAAPAPPRLTVDQAAGLTASVVSAAGAARGTITFEVRTADGDPVAGSGAATPVYTASVVKLAVVQQLLQQSRAGTRVLSPADLDLMARAITASDDTAMSVLWDRHDGVALIAAAVAQFGLTGTEPPERTGQWGEATTSAADTAALLAGLGTALTAEDAELLRSWLRGTTPSGADGFDQRFGLATGTADGTGAKQGWMCCVDGRRQLHSAGTLPDGSVVVLLGDFPSSTSWSAARTALDTAAAAVRGALA